MSIQIALDPGFGNTKVAVNGALCVIQSAVSRPKNIGLAGIGMKAADAATQVETEAGLFAVGENAWHWGTPIGGMDYSALASEARQALFYAGVAQLLNPGEYQVELVIGLPVPLLRNAEQATTVMNQLRDAYRRQHVFRAGGQEYCLDVTRLLNLAQPVGAWNDWLLSEDLRPRKTDKDDKVAVLDIGMNTVDLYAIQNTRSLPVFVGGDKVGVRRLLDRVNGHRRIEESDSSLRSERLKPAKEHLESWLAEVLSVVEPTWPDMGEFEAVIPAGGGAVILGDLLRKALEDRGALVSWPGDPVTANVRGMWKWLAYSSRKQPRQA
jgi:hypothetical protein